MRAIEDTQSKKLEKLKKIKLSEMVAVELKDYIIKNQLNPGNILPTEMELVEMFGVSRPSVREGIKILQNLGIVESRNKKGLIVKEADLMLLQDFLQFHIDSQRLSRMTLYEAIMTIHLGIVPLVIEKITDEHIMKLEKIIDEWKMVFMSSSKSRLLDASFHEIIFEAAGNEIIMQYTHVLKEYLLGKYSEMTPEIAKINLDMHISLLSGLKDRDLDRALSAMLKHNNQPKLLFEEL